MAISLKHTFQSAKADGADTTLVQPSNWNAEHTITAAAGKVLGRDTSGAGAVQELPIAVDTSGNVGIGTNSPGYKLTVSGTASANNYVIQSEATSSAGTFGFTNSNGPAIQVWGTAAAAAGAITFRSSGGEKMRMTDAGNVGIGTSSPGANLHIQNTGSNSVIRLGETTSSQYLDIYRETSTGFSIYNAAQASPFRAHVWQLGGSEAMRIDSAGNVGIGTSSPTAKLDVNDSTIRVRTAKTPASATAAGNAGDICWDSNYVYVCVATNTWKRSALSTW